jgi:F-type H+-transporting ATPase subunit a
MYEIQRRVLIRLPDVFGVDLSITNEVVLLWSAAAATLILALVACRRRSAVAHGWFPNLFESLVDLVDREVVQGGMGPEGRSWSPFLLSLFFLVLVCNLMGLMPLPSVFKPVTSSLSVTAALALLVFTVVVAVNVREHGLAGFLRKFFPSGLPLVIRVLVAPIELVSWLARPLSLAVRLFANMMVGHYLIFTFIGLAMASSWYFKALPLLGAVLMDAFELFICFVQAFIFTMLAGMYIKDAMEEHA